MKLISLNTYGGILGKPFLEFVKENLKSTDIFCFQEIFESKKFKGTADFNPIFFHELQILMKDFAGFYSPSSKNHDVDRRKITPEIFFGLAIFVKKNISVESIKDEMVYRKRFAKLNKEMTNLPKNIQIAKLNIDAETLVVFNFHGIWSPGDKLDTKDRLNQSQKIRELLDQNPGQKILCGDFNLMPSTQSIKILEEDLVNLIEVFNIETTRVERFQRNLPKQNFADYTFVSGDIKVKSFAVPNLEISDHLPMILEFE